MTKASLFLETYLRMHYGIGLDDVVLTKVHGYLRTRNRSTISIVGLDTDGFREHGREHGKFVSPYRLWNQLVEEGFPKEFPGLTKPFLLISFLGKIRILDGWFDSDECYEVLVRWTKSFPQFEALAVLVDADGARMLKAVLPKLSVNEFIAGEMTMLLKWRDDNEKSEIEV